MAKMKAPDGETPEQRFTRTAGTRVSNIVLSLEVLANQGHEVPSDEYTELAFGTIQASVDKAKLAWKAKTPAARRVAFSFATPAVNPNQTSIPVTQTPQGKAQARK
jgi:hypothetical protein